MGAQIHPIKQGDEVAQRIYLQSKETSRELKELDKDTYWYYRNNGMLEADPPRAQCLMRRNVWRACLAPIVHGVDTILSQHVKEQRERGNPLTATTGAESVNVDRVINMYSKSYGGKNLAFLRAAGRLSVAATTKFWSEAINTPDHWAKPILKAYQGIHGGYMDVGARRANFKPHSTSLRYFWQIGIASNITMLNVLAPAGQHASLWPSREGDRQAALLSRANQLSWTASMGAAAFETNFSNQGVGVPAPQHCPFSHDEQTIAERSIWQNPSLRDGPWDPERYCPANIELYGPDQSPYMKISAAALRMSMGLQVAEEIWA